MAIDREATLKNAEKFLRVGRLDAAITEYARVVEDQPRDLTTSNTLGDLYMRSGQPDRAVALYRRIADHLRTEGFYSKAAALYKKILKITPDDESVQMHLAEISVNQGLLADAKAYFGTVANRRRKRGDSAGADEIVLRLGEIDPGDLSARLAAAQALERNGDLAAAASRYRELHDEFIEKGRNADAAAALADCVRCGPSRRDATVLLPLATKELEAGRVDAAKPMLTELLALAPEARDDVTALAWTLAETNLEGATACVDAVVESSIASGEFGRAAAALQEFASRVPGQIGTLLRLVEVSVDGGLESTMYAAQAQLADAYLSAERPEEARVIAEDLVSREPRDDAHVDRLRRALTMLKVDDVEGAIDARVTASATDLSESFDDLMTAEPDKPAATARPTAAKPEEPMDDAPIHPISPATNHAAFPKGDNAQPSSAPPASEAQTEIDLTGMLEQLQAPLVEVPQNSSAGERPTRNLEEVFAGMRQDAARHADEDESSEHLSLAFAYIEMGMPEEAMGSLEIASRSAQHRFTAASALAHLYRDQSDLDKAIEWFERAVDTPPPTPAEGHALLYDLGDVLETMGETSRALAVFLELSADAPDFRDVGDRVTQLSNAETEG